MLSRGKSDLPWLAGTAWPDAAQDAISLPSGRDITASWSAAGQLSTSPQCQLCPLEGDVTIKATQHAGLLERVCDNFCDCAV